MNQRRNFFGELIMACFGMVALARFFETSAIFFVLVAARDFYAAYCFRVRLSATRNSAVTVVALSYVSSILPLAYFPVGDAATISQQLTMNLLSIFGFTLAALATIDLGSSLGVSPAVRGTRVSRGLYRDIRHPMYLGYCIAEAGMAIANPSNLGIFIASISLYAARIWFEERLLRFKTSSGTGLAGNASATGVRSDLNNRV